MEEDTTLVSLSEEKMGFIMMEFGLEGVSLKVSSFKHLKNVISL